MSSTHRRRALLAAATATTLFLVFAPPMLAAPATSDGPLSPVSWVLDWLAHLGGPPLPAASVATAEGTAAPNLDPNGVEAEPPILLLGPAGDGNPIQNEGEIAPNLDPDG